MNMRSIKLVDDFCDLAISRKMYSNKKNLKKYLEYIFGANSLDQRRVLDVGGGRGLLMFYAAVNGAQAVCLEPEFDGSSAGVIKQFQDFKQLLDVARMSGGCSIETTTFQKYDTEKVFDLIVLANSINHLDESAVVSLDRDQVSRDAYLDLFQKMYKMLNKGGLLIITDCDCLNFFNQIGLRSPFMPGIEWKKHQSPTLWLSLLQQVGFQKVSIQWSAPNSLGPIGRKIFGNRLAAYFILSHFRIEVQKPLY